MRDRVDVLVFVLQRGTLASHNAWGVPAARGIGGNLAGWLADAGPGGEDGGWSDVCAAHGVPVTIRDTRGQEIDGACGQLAATER